MLIKTKEKSKKKKASISRFLRRFAPQNDRVRKKREARSFNKKAITEKRVGFEPKAHQPWADN